MVIQPIHFHRKVTDKREDAAEKIKKLSFDDTDGIVCVGGDGTIHEALNGLLLRKDWEKTSQIPIASIPTGN
jgi:sphingosine kinase